METEEFLNIAASLERFHGVFSKFWNLGEPAFTEAIPTAAVSFSDEEDVEFLINPKFWDTLSDYHKQFIVCHECLHVLLNHDIRGKDVDKQLRSVANVAMDVSINHMLIDKFGFVREKIEGWENYCWLDTVFKDMDVEALPNMHFEYYFNLLKSGIDMSDLSLVDVHVFMDEEGNGVPDEVKEALTDAVNGFSEEEKESLKNVLETTTSSPIH